MNYLFIYSLSFLDDGCLAFIGGQNKESYVQTILNVKALMRLKSRQNPK